MAVLWRQVVVAWEQCALYKVAVSLWVLKEASLLLCNVPRVKWVEWELQPCLPLPALWKVIQQIASECYRGVWYVRTCTVMLSEITCHRLLGEAGGTEVIIKLLTDAVSEARQFASDCVTSMAPDGKSVHWNSSIIDNSFILCSRVSEVSARNSWSSRELDWLSWFPWLSSSGQLSWSSRYALLQRYFETTGTCTYLVVSGQTDIVYSHSFFAPYSFHCPVAEYLLCFSCYTLPIRMYCTKLHGRCLSVLEVQLWPRLSVRWG